MKNRRSKFLGLMLTLAILIGSLQIGMASASTTEYTLETPDENLSLGYTQGDYYKLGELKVTATESFDTDYKVVVTVNRASAFTNQSVDNSVLAYDLVISPDNTTIASGDSFNFSAASIDAKQGLEIGTKVTGDFLTAADGFYMDELTFKASLNNALAPLVPPKAGQTDYEFGTYGGISIKWRVLTIDSTNKRALLITAQALEIRNYHSEYSTSITWETCALRSYLNGNFITNNFTADEQSRIVTVTNTNPNNGSISGGNNTDDKMFLLSIAEANNSSYFSNANDRKCTLLSNNSDVQWWLRSPGGEGGYAADVNNGNVDTYGNTVMSDYGVRPAFWCSLTKEMSEKLS